MSEHILDIREEATWIIDWAAYLDDVQSQDPEVAVADGYRNAVLPAGALTMAAISAECLPLAPVVAGHLSRSFRAYGPVVAGDRVRAEVTELPDGRSATFTRDGQVVAVEILRSSPSPPPRGETGTGPSATSLTTGPVDELRIAALLAGLGAMRGEDPSWDQRSPELESFAHRLLLPSLVAVNAAASVRRDIGRRLVRVDAGPLAGEPTRGSPLTVRPAGGTGHATSAVASGGADPFALVTVEITAA